MREELLNMSDEELDSLEETVKDAASTVPESPSRRLETAFMSSSAIRFLQKGSAGMNLRDTTSLTVMSAGSAEAAF